MKINISLQNTSFPLKEDEVKYIKVIADFLEDNQQEEFDFPLDDMRDIDLTLIEDVLAIFRANDISNEIRKYQPARMCKIMTVANFLGMDHPERNMIQAIAKEIAELIRGKTPEEIRALF